MKTQTTSRIIGLTICLCALLSTTMLHAQGSWSTASSDGFTGRSYAASSELGGKIYVMGGTGAGSIFLNSLDVFDPSSNSWTTPATAGTYTARVYLSSASVNGKIYVMGGQTGSWSAATRVNLLEAFDPSTNAWSTPVTTGAFTARSSFTSAVIGNKIYVIGGRNESGFVTAVEVFDPATNQWSTPQVTGTFTARSALTSSVINSKIYAFGGTDGTNVLNTLEVFDPLTNTWSTPTTTGNSTARWGVVSSVLDGKMYVIAGYDAFPYPKGNYRNLVEVFDPATNIWTTPTTSGQLTPRSVPTASVANGKIYVIGGEYDAISSFLSINEFYSPSGSGVTLDPAPQEFALSPNPTNGIVTVHSADEGILRVTISNLLGQQVMEIAPAHVGEFSIDLSNLPSGAYLARFVSAGSVTAKTIIKD